MCNLPFGDRDWCTDCFAYGEGSCSCYVIFLNDVFQLLLCGVFQEAVKMVQPSSKREGFSTIPNVKWEDIGGLDFLRKEFDRYIVRRIKHPEDYEVFRIMLSHFVRSVFVCLTLKTDFIGS